MKEKEEIVEVISKYVPLTKKGRNYYGICPFHKEEDNNPSLAVSKEKQIYTCFVCGAQGNVDTFIKEFNNRWSSNWFTTFLFGF